MPFRPARGDFPTIPLPRDMPPTITIVVDTEEEFDWSGPFDPANTNVENIAEQHLAQTILSARGVQPTYVVTYPVATSKAAVATLQAFADAGKCQIGAHLHPWVTPPNQACVDSKNSYAGNLPPEEERAKLTALTDAIETAFGDRPTIYKAGRYGLGPTTAQTLAALGYTVDVSLVPYSDFSADGGPDFSQIHDQPVHLGPQILGLPLSVGFCGRLAPWGDVLYPAISTATARALHLPGIAARLGLLERLRLTPEGHSCADMLRQVRSALRAGVRSFMLTYHSSSLLPGATPYVRDTAGRTEFLRTLDRFLAIFTGELGGRTDTVASLAARLRTAAP
jgi:hypothetical protein